MHKPNWLFFLNEGGFGGGGTPTVQQPPPAQPTPTPVNQNPVATATDRAATLKKLQYGLSSTVAAGQNPNPVGTLKPAAVPGTGTATTSGGV
jgi:hypothetical protein